MASSTMDPHDAMRSRDVGRLARREQAPRPAHEPGSISESPPRSGPIKIERWNEQRKLGIFPGPL